MRLVLTSIPAALFLWFIASPPGLAATSMLSGMFDAAELSEPWAPEETCTAPAAAYQEVPFTVTVGGDFLFFDAFRDLAQYGAPPVSVRIYAHAYDPANPALNLLGAEPESWQVPRVRLQANAEFVLVVQQECHSIEGAWAVGFDGPGKVRSAMSVYPPAFTSGAFADRDPTAQRVSCGEVSSGRYKKFGPIRVSRTGTYYFAQPLFAIPDAELASVCLHVYTSPPRLSGSQSVPTASLAGYGTVELSAAQDYYFVVQAFSGVGSGRYQFVLVPPAPFRINAGLSDAWHDPDMPAQGVFLDVLDQRNLVFLGWFTYSADALPGHPAPQAWMTAQGPFAGTRAELDLVWTQRPAAAPGELPSQHIDGNVTLDFFDCSSGRLRYAWGGTTDGPAYEGIIPLRRVNEDSVALCESLYAGPASPGPL